MQGVQGDPGRSCRPRSRRLPTVRVLLSLRNTIGTWRQPQRLLDDGTQVGQGGDLGRGAVVRQRLMATRARTDCRGRCGTAPTSSRWPWSRGLRREQRPELAGWPGPALRRHRDRPPSSTSSMSAPARLSGCSQGHVVGQQTGRDRRATDQPGFTGRARPTHGAQRGHEHQRRCVGAHESRDGSVYSSAGRCRRH